MIAEPSSPVGEGEEARGKRLQGRGERPDTRRYHTAGTIEDLRKAEVRDASIHKRLSWNQANSRYLLLHTTHYT